MKLDQTKDELRDERLKYVENRWTQLYELNNEANKATSKYLMLTNSGSALATLSFMGAYKSLTPITAAPWMLALFVSGVILVGIGHAVEYYRMNWLFAKWMADVSKYYENEIGWSSLIKNDTDRTKHFIWGELVGWLSFFCFLIGIFIGMNSVFGRI